MSSQCEQNGGGEEPGWLGSLKEAPPWRSLGALCTQHYKRIRNAPNHWMGHSRACLSPRPSLVGESCQPGGRARRRPALLYLAVRSSWVGPPTLARWCTDMCPVFTCVSTNWSVVASALKSGTLLIEQGEGLRAGGRRASAGSGEEAPTSLRHPPAPHRCPCLSIPKLPAPSLLWGGGPVLQGRWGWGGQVPS